MKIRIAHLVTRPGKAGTYYYWAPSATLKRSGWKIQRLSNDLTTAMHEAQQWNQRVAEWREGQMSPEIANQRRQVARFIKRDTMNHAIRLFLADCETRVQHGSMSTATLRQYRHALKIIADWGGDQMLTAITPKRCRVLLDALATPAKDGDPRLHRASGVGRVLRTLLGFAERNEMIASNPMNKVTIRTPRPRQQIWPDHAITAAVDMADAMGLPSIGDAIILAADTGQREGDLLKLTPRKLPMKNGRMHVLLQQGKTGVWIEAPLTLRAEQRVQAAMHRNRLRAQQGLPLTTRILTRETDGRPWPQQLFIRTFGEVRKQAIAGNAERGIEPCPDLAGLQFRDLRRTIIVRMAEAGVDLPGIAAISGHKIEACKKILETYLPRTGKMAAAAIEMLESHREKSTPPSRQKQKS